MRILWWRLFLAKFIFRHSTIESLLREYRRNSQLRQLCGLQSHYISMNHTNNYVRIVPSYANKVSTKEPDGRRETQADTTAKTYYSNNGTKTTKYHSISKANSLIISLPSLSFGIIIAYFGEEIDRKLGTN